MTEHSESYDRFGRVPGAMSEDTIMSNQTVATFRVKQTKSDFFKKKDAINYVQNIDLYLWGA